MMILKFRMLNKHISIQTSLLILIIIILETFFFFGNIIPILALHEEQQILDNYEDLQEFADAVKDGDEQIEDIPLESMEASNIYADANESLQDCIDLAVEVGDSLTDKEVVHCVDDANYFKNKYSTNSSVPITTTNTTTIGTTASTGTNGTSTSNVISTADDENKLINELVKTGKFTEDEATELVTKVNLINELVKTGKFTEDEATELITKVMNNGTNVSNIPEEVNITEPEVPEEVNITEPEVPEEVNITEPEVPEEVNITEPEVPEVNIPQDNNSNLVNLEISVKQNPISPGEEQTVTLTASDPITGEPVDRIFVHLTIKDPSGNVVKDYTDIDGKLSLTFVIGEDEVGTFIVLGTALQAGVESSESLTFQVQ
jgi:polyhydroxyalkanoate synthesis regulator phasin